MGLYRRGKVWYFTFTYSGHRYQGSLKTQSKKLAEKLYHKIVSDIIEGTYFKNKANKYTFKDLVDTYLKTYQKLRDNYTVKKLLPVFGDYKLSEISTSMIINYMNKRLTEVKPATVYQELALMRRMFNVAIKEFGWINENPVSKISGISALTKNSARDRWLTLEEEQKLLSVASPLWFKRLLIFALDTGMRRSEILNLKWKDIDLKKGFIRVEKSKNGEKRAIPCTKRVISILTEIKKEKIVNISGKVFPHSIDAIRSALQRALEKAQIEDFHFHDLRHTFATRLVQNGVDLYVVKELLGHKTIAMTMRYAHHCSDSLKPFISVLDNLNKCYTAK